MGHLSIGYVMRRCKETNSSEPLVKHILSASLYYISKGLLRVPSESIYLAVISGWMVDKAWEIGERIAEKQYNDYKKELEEFQKEFEKRLSEKGITITKEGVCEINLTPEFTQCIINEYGLTKLTDLPPSGGLAGDLIRGIKDKVETAETTRSPLVLDLDRDGVVETISKENGVYFDHDNNGFKENTAWVNADDGILVYDRNGNGKIDSGLELFGDNTIMSNGKKAENGFEALKDLDSNKDGVFNSLDTAWNGVKVWRDKNQDGILDDGELLTLQEAGVSQIDLNYQNQNKTDSQGNQHNQIGTFTDLNQTKHSINDVWFDFNSSDTKTDTNIEISVDIKKLPNIAGAGNVHSLHTAMELDTTGTLKSLVEKYISISDYDERKKVLIDLIYHWSGVEDMDPNGRNPTQIYGNVLGDSRKLEALEEFLGKEYLGTWCWGERDPNPHGAAAPLLLQAFDTLLEYISFEIDFQSKYFNILETIELVWNEEKNLLEGNIATALEMMREVYNNDHVAGKNLIVNIGAYINRYGNLGAIIVEQFRAQGNADGDAFEHLLVDFGRYENIGTSGNDTLRGSDYDDIIQGFEGDDTIYGNAGNDRLYGNEGNDTIIGNAGDDYIVGGAGNDYLAGGDGTDTYYFEKGFGNDSIYNNDNDAQGTNADKILFGEGISPLDVTFQRDGFDLILKVSNSDSLRIYSYFDQQGQSSATVESIGFLDGTTWNYEYVLAVWNSVPSAGGGKILDGGSGNDTISGTSYDDIISGNKGNDTINSGSGNDRISGGKGDDILDGGAGNDSYYYNLGDGFDTIYDTGNNDKIIFGPGINFSSLSFCYENSDLKIIINGDQSQGMLVKNFFISNSYQIENLVFNNGNIVHLSEIGLTLTQKNVSETIKGTTFNDIIYGNGGYDNISAGTGNDILIGGAGNDVLYGESGDDTYVWNLGDGLDTITEYDGTDKIIFGKGITFEDLVFERKGNELRVYVGSAKTQGISIDMQFYSSRYQVETLEFADGSTFSLTSSGITFHQTDIDESITGTAFNDVIYGNGGDDNISAGTGNDILIGGAGKDTLDGASGDDTYVWNLGDGFDKISDSSGTDKIVFGKGVNLNNLTFEKSNNDLNIYINNDKTQGISIYNYYSSSSYRTKTIEFTNGSTLDLRTIIDAPNEVLPQTINGTDGNDVLAGGSVNDTINASDGDDIIIGGKGDDKLYGSYDNDTYIYNLGDGFDTIYEDRGDDKIVFGEGISLENLSFSIKDTHLIIYINGDSHQGMMIDKYFNSNQYKIETIEFADGSTFNLSTSGLIFTQSNTGESITTTIYDDTIYGNGGDDNINAGHGSDILVGGTGKDNLNGGSGNDTYIWNLGDGFDTITDTSGKDKLVFGNGIVFESLTFENSGNSLNIYVNGDHNQGISIYNFFYNSDNIIETIEFADGNTFKLDSSGLTFIQGEGSETISGTGYNDIIYANGGDDTINAGNGNDKIYGGNGKDTINAGNSNDVLVGGAGNDTLSGGYGDDTYIWNLGDGFDEITDSSGQNKIILGEGIAFEDLSFERKDNYLNIYVNNNKTQGISITNFFYSSDYKISEIEFANGFVFNLATSGLVLNQTNRDDNISATSYDDIIYGNGGDDSINAGTGNDILIGGAGNDILQGGAGDDAYIWNLGDGFDTISESSGNDKIVFGAGISLENLSFERADNNLIVYINGDKTQGMIINNHFNSSYDYRIETIEFADGSSINTSKINIDFETNNKDQTIQGTDFNDIINGGLGNDSLYGNDGEDILIGGKGNDILQGGYGRDTYMYNLGDGFDTITEVRGEDKIVFGEGINPSDISFRQDGSHLIISIGSDANQGIKIAGFYSNIYNKIEFIQFSNGTVLSIADRGIILNQTNAHDNVSGTSYDDTIYGNSGNDTILGNAGNDTLIGGIGSDILQGGADNDTYVWNLGDGMDTITEIFGNDKILFGNGILYSDLKFAQDGKDLIIVVKNDVNQGMRIKNFYNSNDNKVETLQFANGTTRALSGFNLTDNDNLYMYSLNSGLSVISETGGNNAIKFSAGISLDTLSFARDDADSLMITFADNETDGIKIMNYFKSEVNQVQTLLFVDNTDFNLSNIKLENVSAKPEETSNIIESSASNINGTIGDDVIYSQSNGIVTVNAGAGNDIITAGNGINTINGGNGNDIMSAGNGINTLALD